MSTLIIGASGYAGSAISQACAQTGRNVLGVSRSGVTGIGIGIRGDVQRPSLGLSPVDLELVTETTTEAVLCFGSVAWDCGPSAAIALHDTATRGVLRFLRTLPRLRRVVHFSSLLVLGRATGTLSNRELYVGQRFRNWYEYGKYCAERLVRDSDLPVNVIRCGPLLGVDPRGGPFDVSAGLPAAFGHLLAGYPVHLRDRGKFPCYVADVATTAEIVVRALETPEQGVTWSWFDPEMPTLADVFREVCRPWGMVPKIVEAPVLGRLTRLLSTRLGVVPELADYAEPWFDLPRSVLDAIPGELPRRDPDYLAATGRALRDHGMVSGRRR
ncbi:MAG: SDR family oxidoreductase [Pseudonocardiaceae bacterium]